MKSLLVCGTNVDTLLLALSSVSQVLFPLKEFPLFGIERMEVLEVNDRFDYDAAQLLAATTGVT